MPATSGRQPASSLTRAIRHAQRPNRHSRYSHHYKPIRPAILSARVNVVSTDPVNARDHNRVAAATAAPPRALAYAQAPNRLPPVLTLTRIGGTTPPIP
ncbi:hypothetical protein [Gordonia humi]|uniref:Uncharacterized protein n=1 Tax=Gordonia humi TaxID=686429 RepID=A0A840F6C0_9ACTN|nr:hypothetical protein [Gordonia humi]MBB4138103.1 hypothetical protein [Gordonia humi]